MMYEVLYLHLGSDAVTHFKYVLHFKHTSSPAEINRIFHILKINLVFKCIAELGGLNLAI